MKKLILLGCVLLLMAGSVLGLKVFAAHFIDAKLRSATARVKERADINFRDVEVSVLNMNLVVNDVDVAMPTGQTVHIESIVVHDMDVKHKPPLHAKVSLKAARLLVNQENFGSEYKEIQELGYEELLADVDVQYAYAPDKRTFQLQNLRLDIAGLGLIHASLECSNFDLARLRALELDDLVVERLFFSYEDRSLLRTLIQITAVDEREIIDFLVAGLREDIERAEGRQQISAASTMREIIKFIETPVGITVDVQLGQPTPMGQILISKKITDIVKLFSITVNSAS